MRLPPDAFVEFLIEEVLCVFVEGVSCPETPIIVLERWSSTIAVSVNSGKVVEEAIAPGEEGAFDFLKAVLRRP